MKNFGRKVGYKEIDCCHSGAKCRMRIESSEILVADSASPTSQLMAYIDNSNKLKVSMNVKN